MVGQLREHLVEGILDGLPASLRVLAPADLGESTSLTNKR
jgi:hypothetical protein